MLGGKGNLTVPEVTVKRRKLGSLQEETQVPSTDTARAVLEQGSRMGPRDAEFSSGKMKMEDPNTAQRGQLYCRSQMEACGLVLGHKHLHMSPLRRSLHF